VLFIMIKPGSDEGDVPPRYLCAVLPAFATGLALQLERPGCRSLKTAFAGLALMVALFGFIYPHRMGTGLLRHAFFGLRLLPGFSAWEIVLLIFYGLSVFLLSRRCRNASYQA
jgi:hypothetical protein